MTHSTVEVPLQRLRFPEHVEYGGGTIYRAWKPIRLAPPLGGVAVIATRAGSEQQQVLIYNGVNAPVLKVVG